MGVMGQKCWKIKEMKFSIISFLVGVVALD